MKTKTILSLALILIAAGLFGMGSQAALYTTAEDLVDTMIAWSKECVGKTDADCSRNLDALRKTAFKAAEFANENAQITTDDKNPDGDAIGNGKAGWKAHWRMYQQLFIYHGKCFNRYDAKECREMWVAQDKERTRLWHLYGPEPRWRDFPDALRHRTFKPIPTKHVGDEMAKQWVSVPITDTSEIRKLTPEEAKQADATVINKHGYVANHKLDTLGGVFDLDRNLIFLENGTRVYVLSKNQGFGGLDWYIVGVLSGPHKGQIYIASPDMIRLEARPVTLVAPPQTPSTAPPSPSGRADEPLNYTTIKTWPEAIIVVRPGLRHDEAKLVTLVKQVLLGAPDDGRFNLRIFDNVECAQRTAAGKGAGLDPFQDTCIDHFVGNCTTDSNNTNPHLLYLPKDGNDWPKYIEIEKTVSSQSNSPLPNATATAPPGSGGLQAQDKYLDDQGRVITREQAEAANLAYPWGNIVSISPDGHWLLCFRHYGSHAEENYLYHSDDGVRFVPAKLDKKVLESRPRYASKVSNTSHFETAEGFDTRAWDFARAVEHIKVTEPVDVYPAEFVSWSSDSAKLLFSLTGRLNNTDKELTVDIYSRNDRKKLGVADWRAYYNMRTQQFELTDELRATNKEARKRWSEGSPH